MGQMGKHKVGSGFMLMPSSGGLEELLLWGRFNVTASTRDLSLGVSVIGIVSAKMADLLDIGNRNRNWSGDDVINIRFYGEAVP